MCKSWSLDTNQLEQLHSEATFLDNTGNDKTDELARFIKKLCEVLVDHEQQMLTMIKRASELPDPTASP